MSRMVSICLLFFLVNCNSLFHWLILKEEPNSDPFSDYQEPGKESVGSRAVSYSRVNKYGRTSLLEDGFSLWSNKHGFAGLSTSEYSGDEKQNFHLSSNAASTNENAHSNAVDPQFQLKSSPPWATSSTQNFSTSQDNYHHTPLETAQNIGHVSHFCEVGTRGATYQFQHLGQIFNPCSGRINPQGFHSSGDGFHNLPGQVSGQYILPKTMQLSTDPCPRQLLPSYDGVKNRTSPDSASTDIGHSHREHARAQKQNSRQQSEDPPIKLPSTPPIGCQSLKVPLHNVPEFGNHTVSPQQTIVITREQFNLNVTQAVNQRLAQQGGTPSQNSRVSRACDNCSRRKIKVGRPVFLAL